MIFYAFLAIGSFLGSSFSFGGFALAGGGTAVITLTGAQIAALGVGLDIYDSIQRGVSPGGVVLGAALTATKGVGLIYLNKGIMYATTTIGGLLCPAGAVVGFVVGGIISIIVGVLLSNLIDDSIDMIAK